MKKRFLIALIAILGPGCARGADDGASTDAPPGSNSGPCAIEGEATNGEGRAWAVREAPDGESRIIGRLYPAMDPHDLFHDARPSLAEGGVGPQFTIEAISGDWLRIADIDPFTDGLDINTGLMPAERNFQGTGWVRKADVRVFFVRVAAHERPGLDSPRVAEGVFGQGMNARFLIGCRGNWAQLEHIPSGGETADTLPIRGWMLSRGNRERADSLREVLRSAAH